MYVLSLQVTLELLVCQPCRDDVTRVLANSKDTPRWAKGSCSSARHTWLLCTQLQGAAFVSTMLGNSDQMKHAFISTGIKCSHEIIPTPTPLCKYHYHILYTVLNSVQRQCATCDTWLKYTSHRSCPKPEVIQEYLKEHTGFEGQIQDHDQVCLTCYK